MRASFFRFWLATGAMWAAMSGLGNRLQAMQADDSLQEREVTLVIDAESAEGEQEEAPKFWLGISLKPLEGDLATYLGSTDGVLVDSVFPNSPASAAGLEKGDILVAIGDAKLTDPKSLLTNMKTVKAGDDGKVTPLKFSVLRKGKSMMIELTPASRPKEAVRVGVDLEGDSDGNSETTEQRDLSFSFDLENKSPEEIEKMLEKLKGANGAALRVFRFGTPARVWQKDGDSKSHTRMEIHKSVDGKQMEISIKREGDGPANITVSSDGTSKEYTSDDLDAMPKEARNIVTEMLKNKGRVAIEAKVHAGAHHKDGKSDDHAKESHEKTSQSQGGITIMGPDGMKIELKEFMNKEMAEKYRAMADEIAARAHHAAEWAHQAAAMPKEIKELQSQVESLRAEIKELREQLKSK